MVPFDVTELTKADIQEAVNQAIAFLRSYTGFDFVPRTTEEDFIRFREDDKFDIAGSSSFGRAGGPQTIHINPGHEQRDGELVTHVLHEIGHALGMPHEQTRPDRDGFVIFAEENLKDEDDESSYEMWGAGEVVLPTSYDYGSRMQYRPTGKAKPGSFTLDVNTSKGHPLALREVMGTSKLMSKRDVATLNYIADPLPAHLGRRGRSSPVAHQLRCRLRRRARAPAPGPLRSRHGGPSARQAARPARPRFRPCPPRHRDGLRGSARRGASVEEDDHHASLRDDRRLAPPDPAIASSRPRLGADRHPRRLFVPRLGVRGVASGHDNPFPGSPKSSGAWSTTEGQMIGSFHALVPLDSGHILDWVPRASFFRIWQLAVHRTDESIFTLPTLAEGFWDDLDTTAQIIALAGARILEWDADGNYRISDIAVTPAIPIT